MDKKEIIKLLNEDITGEIEAILIYMRNSFVTENCPPSRKMEEVAKDEMRHTEWLAELIVDLGGVPSMEHKALNFGKEGAEGFLTRLVGLEEGAISQYKDHIKRIPDEEIKKKLQHILEEEEEHLKGFKEHLEKLKKG